MKVEVWSDVMCPFCYIGKRNYENALSGFDNGKYIDLEWKSFQLDPDIPEEGVEMSSAAYLSSRKGIPEDKIKEMHEQLIETASNTGLEFNFENAKVANSFKSHRIIQFAKTKDLADQAEETFFKAYFTDGIDLNNETELIKIAKEIGLTEKEAEIALTDDQFSYAVKSDIMEASQLGVSGVPFFVVNRKYAISGAQPPKIFLETLQKAFAEWKVENREMPIEEVSKGESCSPDGDCD